MAGGMRSGSGETLAKFASGEKFHYRDLIFPHRAFETLGIFPKLRQVIEVASKAGKIRSAEDWRS
jgi:hypothetical protein